ncbi:hypothetical protein RchiOBHm_Chr3g0462971 [Rosa chinensis]|uniref:Uncharacterized protein n=1 Tax=Rosa chinensis TaxID=74649 RepID=A0A2P6R930_ROSCH|nr:hypothetical protein RchiOBHm_Chr3g0462971 [Rosa chinensis]
MIWTPIAAASRKASSSTFPATKSEAHRLSETPPPAPAVIEQPICWAPNQRHQIPWLSATTYATPMRYQPSATTIATKT